MAQKFLGGSENGSSKRIGRYYVDRNDSSSTRAQDSRMGIGYHWGQILNYWPVLQPSLRDSSEGRKWRLGRSNQWSMRA